MNTEQNPGHNGQIMEVELKFGGQNVRFVFNPETMEVVFPANQFAQLNGFKDMHEMLLDNHWMDAFIEEQNRTGKFPVSPPPADQEL